MNYKRMFFTWVAGARTRRARLLNIGAYHLLLGPAAAALCGAARSPGGFEEVNEIRKREKRNCLLSNGYHFV